MDMTRDFSAVVGKIYDAVLAPQYWQEALTLLCAAVQAKAASINVVDPIEGRVSMFVEHGTEPAWTALLMSTYAGMSPIGAAVLVADVDQPIGAFDFIDEEEYVESRFYKEWCQPQGYHDLLGALIAKRPREVGSLSTTRGREKGRFGADERKFVGLVAPHVRRAVTISGLLEGRTVERNALAGVIDNLSAAVVLVDREANIVRCNPAGERLLAEGVVATAKVGRLLLASAEANIALQPALAGGTGEPVLIPIRDSAGGRNIAAVMPAETRNGILAVIISRQDEEIPAIGKHLAQLFALTPREVAVLMPLVEGRTIEETSAMLGISEATARTHLKRLMTKTGTNRQVELIQIVLRSMPPVSLSNGRV